MTTANRPHPRSIPTKRLQTSGVSPRARSHKRSQPATDGPTAIPAMGLANRAPGVPVMGRPGRSSYPAMGGPDAALHLSVMGAGDRGAPTGLFGDSSARFVDLLFTPRGR